MSCTGGRREILARLDAQLAEAAAALESELGSDTACTLHRDGRITGGLKYHEGRLIATRQMRRAVEGSADAPGAARAIAAIRADWLNELDRWRAGVPPSQPWIAYASGGVDATTAIAVTAPPA